MSARKRRYVAVEDALSVADLFTTPGTGCAEVSTIALLCNDNCKLHFSRDLLMLHSAVFRGMLEELEVHSGEVELKDDGELVALALKLLFDAAKCRPYDESQFSTVDVANNELEVDFHEQQWTPERVSSKTYPLREFIAVCDKYAFKWVLAKLDGLLSNNITDPILLVNPNTRAQVLDGFLKLCALALEYNLPSLGSNIRLKMRTSKHPSTSQQDEDKLTSILDANLENCREPYSVYWGIAQLLMIL